MVKLKKIIQKVIDQWNFCFSILTPEFVRFFARPAARLASRLNFARMLKIRQKNNADSTRLSLSQIFRQCQFQAVISFCSVKKNVIYQWNHFFSIQITQIAKIGADRFY
jgi:hypothetical protein